RGTPERRTPAARPLVGGLRLARAHPRGQGRGGPEAVPRSAPWLLAQPLVPAGNAGLRRLHLPQDAAARTEGPSHGTAARADPAASARGPPYPVGPDPRRPGGFGARDALPGDSPDGPEVRDARAGARSPPRADRGTRHRGGIRGGFASPLHPRSFLSL